MIPSASKLLIAILGMSLLFGGIVLATAHFSSSTSPADSAPLTATSFPDMQTCAECHEEIVNDFLKSPHANTLARGEDFVHRYAGKIYSDADRHWEFGERNGKLTAKCNSAREVVVDWIFGSGKHAQTPLSTFEGRSLDGLATECWELPVSWYPHHGLGMTLGNAPGGATHELGSHKDEMETRRCFECHSHNALIGNELNLSGLSPGLHCGRCHNNLNLHVASSGEQPVESWGALSPLESVRRCGECHRRADQMTQTELHPDNSLLIRFASVGLEQSKCFQNQAEIRFDCLSCHDPHRNSVLKTQKFVAVCLKCHSKPEQIHCSQAPQSGNCLKCHMPKVEVQEHLEFTDHWIRIREK